jgi:imidazole glycerol-phosphate synthase subunit HisH
MLVIVDYGVGNLGSIYNMLRRIGVLAKVSSNPDDISAADKLILPGVGAFDYGIGQLRQKGLFDVLNKRIITDGIPILGICLGMQLFAEQSEEGTASGLGWLPAKVIRFRSEELGGLKVPHMGWADARVIRPCALFSDMDSDQRFYFVHSYHMVCSDSRHVKCHATHGYEFPAVIQAENVVGVQFHPEKSHRFGMTLLKNFVESY